MIEITNPNPQVPSKSQITMTKIPNKAKEYDLEKRTLEFSKRIVRMCKVLPKDIINIELIKQGLRSGTAIGSNYIEANDALSKRDFVHRLRIARKEAKETIYWLELIIEANQDLRPRVQPLEEEADELKKILSAIIEKSGIKLK